MEEIGLTCGLGDGRNVSVPNQYSARDHTQKKQHCHGSDSITKSAGERPHN